jgi:hypothetical protein
MHYIGVRVGGARVGQGWGKRRGDEATGGRRGRGGRGILLARGAIVPGRSTIVPGRSTIESDLTAIVPGRSTIVPDLTPIVSV